MGLRDGLRLTCFRIGVVFFWFLNEESCLVVMRLLIVMLRLLFLTGVSGFISELFFFTVRLLMF